MRACICFIFVLACLGRWKTEDESYQENLPAKERVFVASKIYSLLQSGFFCAKIATSQELDQPYKNYLRKVLDTDDRRKFDLATIEFVAQLHSGHTFFWDTWLNESNGRPIGFYALPFDGKWAIQSSALEDLKPGDVISKIDDTAIEPFFLQRQRYISASSRAAQRRNLFLLPYLFPERFTLTLDDGKQIAVDRLKVSKPPQKVEGRW